ncbi:MAG: hypothetical protein AAF658_17295 [Myxococcota bacterium]
MRRSSTHLVGVALLVTLPFSAGAQGDDEDAAKNGQTEVVATPTDAAPSVNPEEDDQPEIEQVPDSEKGERADAYLATMKKVLRTVLGYLEEAREERDVVKLNCINEKLTAVKGLLRISEASDLNLREALARRDPDASGHEFEKIAIAARKVDQLRAESEACVGELAVYSGDTQVEVVVSGEPTAQPDPAASPPVIDVVVRPPAASPTQN